MSSDRFTEDDVLGVLTAAVDVETTTQARAVAAAWLQAACQDDTRIDGDRDRPALEALGSLFRVPADYFVDEPTSATVMERLDLAAEAHARGFCTLGPCRTRHLDPGATFALHRQMLAEAGGLGPSGATSKPADRA